jgi:hypothetical protein
MLALALGREEETSEEPNKTKTKSGNGRPFETNTRKERKKL